MKEFSILKFPAIYSFQIGKLVFLFTKGLLPNAFCNKFQLVSETHSYQTQEILVNSIYSLAELISDNCLHLITDHRFGDKGVYCQTAKLRHKTIN